MQSMGKCPSEEELLMMIMQVDEGEVGTDVCRLIIQQYSMSLLKKLLLPSPLTPLALGRCQWRHRILRVLQDDADPEDEQRLPKREGPR